jgi:hypothetical protein
MMTDESPYLRCLNCGWVHFGVARPQPAPDRCFRCKRFAFEVIDEAELLRTVPRGVTLQGLRWPPIIRPPTIPKDKLTAADIEGPWVTDE